MLVRRKKCFLTHEEVYMLRPSGFEVKGEERRVCRLKKSLHGLKQSPNAWFDEFNKVVVGYGLKRLRDHSIFVRHSHSQYTILAIYMDYILIIGNDMEVIATLNEFLGLHFYIEDLSALRYFIGIEVGRSKEDINQCQRKNATDLLSETRLLGAKPVDTLIDPYFNMSASDGVLFEDT